jgi:NAD+ diphosphatase
MAFRLYDLPETEPSRLVGFAGNRIDRLSEKRQDDSAFTALELPETRVMVLGGNKLLLDYTQENAPRALFSLEQAQAFSPDLNEPVLLGLQDGAPIVALMAPLDPDALAEPFRAQDYRSIYMEGLVPADMRHKKRNACRWWQTCVPELRCRAFSAH